MKGFFGCLLFIFVAAFLAVAIFDLIYIKDAIDALTKVKKSLANLSNSFDRKALEATSSELTKAIWQHIVSLVFKFGVFIASMFVLVKKVKEAD